MTTQEKIANALKDVNGEKESILIVHCNNKKRRSQIGWVGDMEQIASAIASKIETLPNAIEQNERNDVGFALCILQAIASADLRTNGLVTAMIDEVKHEVVKKTEQYAN